MLALRSARTDRTLLVSTDPASSLSSVLKADVGPDPAPVRGAPRLSAASIDSRLAFSRWLAPRRELVASIALEGTYLDGEDVERLLKLSLPGVDEVIGLLEMLNMTRTLDVGSVVVDTAPTGHTLRLLTSPALFARLAAVLDALQSHHRTVVSALRGFYVAEPADALVAEVIEDANAMTALLRDGRSTELIWVTLPEPAALEETADAVTFLEGAGMHVRRLIVNRVTPPPPTPCEWCDARRRFEARALAPVARRFRDREIQWLPEIDREPRGITDLRTLARSLGSRHQAGAAAVRHRVQAVLASRTSPRSAALDLTAGARWILFGGKGGVGKSTCAAGAALQLASADPSKRVLLLSTDPAHSLGDIFGTGLDDQPRSIDAAPQNLQVREIDAAAGFDDFKRRYVDSVDAAFGRLSRPDGGERDTFRQLIELAPPGIDEVMAVADVAAALAASSGPDVIVTDTAPTGHALRLLQTPAVLREWTQALMTILLKYRELVGAGSLAALLVDVSKRLRSLESVLRDPALTRFVIVTRAAALPMEQTRALQQALADLKIAAAGIIVNAVGAGTCRHCRGTIARQVESVRRLRASVASEGDQCAIIEAPAEVPPPHGPGALMRWTAAWRRLAS
jgi:arsenite-transporting ATPase